MTETNIKFDFAKYAKKNVNTKYNARQYLCTATNQNATEEERKHYHILQKVYGTTLHRILMDFANSIPENPIK